MVVPFGLVVVCVVGYLGGGGRTLPGLMLAVP